MPNRNAESYFSQVPSLHTQRSIFKRPFTHKTTFNVGSLIPVFVDFLMPGDGVSIKTSKIVRTQTMLSPVMDNLYLDMYWFAVDMVDIWSHTKEFWGENTQSAWLPSTIYQIPSISSPTGGFSSGGLADYMGLPVGVEWTNNDEGRPMALPFRAYALICNEFFRDENLTDPLNIPLGDTNQTGTNGSSYINDVANGGMPFKVAKYHDYFTSATKEPQKGPTVSFPLLGNDLAPVGTRNEDIRASTSFGRPSLHWYATDGSTPSAGQHFNLAMSTNTAGDTWFTHTRAGATESNTKSLAPANMWADLSSTVGAVTINQLRLAIQLQSYYERLAITGSRMTEVIRGIWGVTPDDRALHRPEYLGGNRIALNVNEVVNTAQATNDYLGDLGAMSRTVDTHYDFEYSSRSWTILIGVCCARYDHTYSQGIEAWWNRLDALDFYNPYFANIGYTPIYEHQIYATPANMAQRKVFGYQEAWGDMRFGMNRVSGEMRPGVPNTLAFWHYADYYNAEPTLSDSWIREDPTNVDRTLAVSSQVSNQIFADFYFDATYTRIMPMYSVPGIGKTL